MVCNLKRRNISIIMGENLKELSEKLENIDKNLDTLLLTLDSSENVTFGNYKIKSAQVNRNEQKANISIEGISYIDAENAFYEAGTLKIDNFSFEKSFITGYTFNRSKTIFTLAIGNLSFINNNKHTFNIAIWEKPQQLDRIDSYINDNVNFTFLCFELYGIKFTIINQNDKLFLVADRDITEDKFLKYTRGIKLALGFLMCDFIGGTNTFLLTDKEICSIENFKIFNMIGEQNLNFNIMIDSLPILGNKYQNKLNMPTKLSNIQFVNLCQLIIENPQVETAIHYIAQSANLSIEHKLTFLAVALEALTGYVGENINNEKKKVIDSTISINKLLPPKEFKILQKKYYNMIDDYKLSSERDENENNSIKAVLKGKFQNRKSNRDSLSQPFKLYNIELSQDDISMLEKRNDLLHGKPFDYNNEMQEDIKNFQNQANIYYHLLYVLVLKIIGYEGVVFNLKAWLQILNLNNNSFNQQDNQNDTKDLFLEI